MAEIFALRKGRAFVPLTAVDDEALDVMPEGKPARLKVSYMRNIRALNFYWKMVDLIRANHPFLGEKETLHLYIKAGCGLLKEKTLPSGQVILTEGTISFAGLDEVDFKAFLDKALDFIVEDVIPGLKRQDVIREIERMAGVRYAELFPKKPSTLIRPGSAAAFGQAA